MLALAGGLAWGSPAVALVASIGALNTAFSDGQEPYLVRARRMLATGVLCGIAVLAGGLFGGHPAATTAVAGAGAFAAGMMVALGTAPTEIGRVGLVSFLVFSAQTAGPREAVFLGLAALLGGVLQTALSLIFWPFERYAPERRALADLYGELARAAASATPATEAPPASAQATRAWQTLASLNPSQSLEAERLLALLTQAERSRLALLSLARIRVRLERDWQAVEEPPLLAECGACAGRLLAAVGDSLRLRIPAGPHEDCLEGIRSAAARLRANSREASSDGKAALLHDARSQLDALGGQLRAAVELAGRATPVGSAEFEAREAARPWFLRLGGAVAVLRANLTLKSPAFRHALRMTVCVALGEALAHIFGWSRAYWIPMTSAIVLRPDFVSTFERGLLRVFGTLAGLVASTALFHLLAPAPGVEVALVGMFAFLLRCFGPVNYGIFTATLTALVVVLIAIPGAEPGPVIVARGLSTIAGGGLALVAYRLWPTWEQTSVQPAVAGMLDAYRAYFQAVRDRYLTPDGNAGGSDALLDRARQAARLARSNLEASAARLRVEPGTKPERINALDSVLADSHRLVHAIMSLEAGLFRSRPAPARQEFRVFSNHVDLTLYLLAAALRGSPVSASDLPDLREDHRALLESGDRAVERYAMTNTETDRITNSLNTLAGEVVAWTSGEGRFNAQ